MPYRLLINESVQNGVRRILNEQIQRAIDELQDGDMSQGVLIHQVRKRCKKIRSVLRLVRPAMGDRYEEENARYRAAARSLSAMRDATAMIETYEELHRRYTGDVDGRVLVPIRRHLAARRQAVAIHDTSARERLEEFEKTMMDGRKGLAAWTLSDDGFDAIAGGLGKTYTRAQSAMRTAYEKPSPETFHEWRKRVKYHGQHIRLLREVWPAMMQVRRDEVDRLGELLGEHHNLCVLREPLLAEPASFAKEETIAIFTGLIDRRLMEIQVDCEPLGKRLFAEKPKRLVSRLGEYWNVWSGDN